MRARLAVAVVATGLLAASWLTPRAGAELDRDTIVGMWLFEENAGGAAEDGSGMGHDGILEGGAAWTDGKYGTALDFNGGGYVELEDSAVDLPFGAAEPFTITAWVNPRAGGTVVGKFNGGVVGAYILSVAANGSVTFHREVAPWSLQGSGDVDAGEFWHVAATYDGGEMKIYVDGEEVAAQDRGAQNTDTATPVLIGARFTGGAPAEFYDGVIDEVGLFNIALSEDDVQEAMRGLAGPESVEADGKAAVTWGHLRLGR
jgi:hypothetical protein